MISHKVSPLNEQAHVCAPDFVVSLNWFGVHLLIYLAKGVSQTDTNTDNMHSFSSTDLDDQGYEDFCW